MKIELISGTDAARSLEDVVFLDAWKALHEKCPWATVYQGPSFVATWFRCYEYAFSPLLLVGSENDGSVCGLITLAVSLEDNLIVVAGAHQAEYQAWLTARDDTDFPKRAIRKVFDSYPIDKIVFRYLPAGAPTTWTADAKSFAGRCSLETFPRPLMQIGDGSDCLKSLKKHHTKNRINRLGRLLGEVKFERITDPGLFNDYWQELIDFHDIRMGAIFGVTPFRDDKGKESFHRAMLEVPSLMHATILRAGDHLLVAHLGLCDGATVRAGILAFSPRYAKHSLGRIQINSLGKLMAEEDFKTLDLSPGGDRYKEGFANDHDEVRVLTLWACRRRRRVEAIQQSILATGSKMLRSLRVQPDAVKQFARKIRPARLVRLPGVLTKKLVRDIHSQTELRVYWLDIETASRVVPKSRLQRDNLGDLLCYKAVETWQSRALFLSGALKRLANEEHVYTFVEDGILLHYGWLTEKQDRAFFSEINQHFKFPAGTACLYDFYTVPTARGRGLYQLSVQTMLQDIAKVPSVERVAIACLSDNGPSRHVIEKTDFAYHCSLFERRVLGRSRHWQEPDLSGP